MNTGYRHLAKVDQLHFDKHSVRDFERLLIVTSLLLAMGGFYLFMMFPLALHFSLKMEQRNTGR